MAKAIESALSAIAAFPKSPLDAKTQGRVGAALLELRRIEADLQSVPLRRPFIDDLVAKRQAASSIVRMGQIYLEALIAPTLGDAQVLGRQAQEAIDRAVTLLDQSEKNQERGNRLGEGGRRDFARAAMEVLAELYPDSDLLAVDAIVQVTVAGDLGRPVAAGQGINYAVAEVLATAMLDADRFRAVVRQASQLIGTAEELATIASEPGALNTLRRARDAIVDSTSVFASSLEGASTDEARLRRVLILYRELFEDAGSALFAWFLRIARAKSAPISKLMKEDSTALLRAIEQNAALADIFLGADAVIRNASSHGQAYELVGDDVVFNLRSSKGSMSVEVLIDVLLAMIESLLAAFWVLDNELATLGVDGHNSDSSLAGFSLLAVAEEVLKLLGAEVLNSDEASGTWTFTVGPNSRTSPFVMAAGLSASPPNDIDVVTIVRPDLAASSLRIPRSAMTAFHDAKDLDSLELIWANLIFLRASQLDDSRVMTADHLRRTTSIGAVALLHQDDRGAVPFLRRCMSMGREDDVTDVVDLVQLALTEWRGSDPNRLKTIRATIAEWQRLPEPAQPLARETSLLVRE